MTGTIAYAGPHPIADYMQAHCVGQARALTYSAIAAALGMSARDFRNEVKRMRREEHAPIVSDCVHGYWWATDARELRDFRHAMIRRGIEDIRSGRGVFPAELDMAGQTHITNRA